MANREDHCPDPGLWIPPVTELAKAAGKRILEIYETDFAVAKKDDRSPLTAADLAAHQTIISGLARLTPELPVLSEESAAISYQERKNWHCYWLVDPLDGTREFIKRNGEFTVNIALVCAGEPVLGVIHAPVLQKTYSAVLGVGAFLRDNTQTPSTVRLINAKTPSANEIVRIVGSRSHAQPGMDALLNQFPQHELIAVGSSLKFCLIAEGSAHLYPRLGPTMLWDTGAGHVIAIAAGASVHYDGIEGPAYQRAELRNGNFTVSSLA